MAKKISQIAEETSPATSDYAPGVKSSITGTRRFTWANLITLFFNNIPAAIVANAKLKYGLIWRRLGGSSTVWSTAGTTTYDSSAVDTYIQTGVSSGAAGADTTVTFPTAYSGAPSVVGSDFVTGNNCFFVLVSVSTTQFVFRMIDSGGVQRTNNCAWIAIGPV